MTERRLHVAEDGLTYDEDGHFVHTGVSPFSEDEDIDPDWDPDEDDSPYVE